MLLYGFMMHSDASLALVSRVYELFTRLLRMTCTVLWGLSGLGIQLTLLSVTDTPVGGVRCVEDMPQAIYEAPKSAKTTRCYKMLQGSRETPRSCEINLLFHLISSEDFFLSGIFWICFILFLNPV